MKKSKKVLELEDRLEELENELFDIETQQEEYENDSDNFEDQFNDYLDENFEEIEIVGLNYSPSYVLKEIDETAYYDALSNWFSDNKDEIIEENHYLQRLLREKEGLEESIEEIKEEIENLKG